ncbi:phosphoglycerate kinase [Namhaeicola litoreus]|uniref:Phosphoglycerate kinase n=1 Tax=Namhaeicola litoreus TaxID=1052145 RepID=A0ABW3XXS0_9FLAO
MKTLDSINFENKKALIRVDFNVPLDENFKVTDATRIEAAKPTIIKVLEDGGSVILMTHLGRPKGKDENFSLKHILGKVSEIIGVKVKFATDCIGQPAETAAANLQNGEVLLLENVRFYKEEEAGDVNFAKKLAALGDAYVNDAFGTAHRAHASTTIVAQFFPDAKCFGYLMAREIDALNTVLNSDKKPVTAIIGGAKVSSKIDVMMNIMEKVDNIIIGGGMAYTFVKAQGGKIGESIVEDDKMEVALDIIELAKKTKTRLHFPIDVIAADAFSEDAKTQVCPINDIPDGWMGLDAGPKSNVGFSFVIADSKTILWNGPVGVFEMDKFAKGTIELGNAIADATEEGAFSLVGGGDSVAAVKKFGFEDKVSYVSTGGGAMLEMLEGKTLPGIQAILD